MTFLTDNVRSHYDSFLARHYLWMAGGFEENIRKNKDFFVSHAITPSGTRVAVDLGAGCGFQTLALASEGFDVVAVDFCRPLLDFLALNANNRQVRIIPSDILAFSAWANMSPELIVCMGDTLTHLPEISRVRSLIHNCDGELGPGGKIILSWRDYTGTPAGSSEVIPVQRDCKNIFLCNLEYDDDRVHVTDIVYTQESGSWERQAGTYTKLRLARDTVTAMLAEVGLMVALSELHKGVNTMITVKIR